MNQTTNHTPGPWQVFNGGALIGTAENSDGSRYIADIRYIPGGESVSNARLIAAAPEMAEEISKQIAWLKHARSECTGVIRESLLTGFDQSIKYLSAVLAKAEGR